MTLHLTKHLFLLLATSLALATSLHGYQQRLSRNVTSLSAYPLITGDLFRNICHHKLDEAPFNPNDVEEGDLIFASCTNLKVLFSLIDEIPNRFILISHLTPVTRFEFTRHLDHPKIVAWFAKNADGSHPKLHYLPNGVGRVKKESNFATHFDPLRMNVSFCPSSVTYSILNQTSLDTWREKEHLLSSNFTMRYNKKDRQPVYDLFAEKPYCTFFPLLPKDEYIQTLMRSCFTLSPRGSGLDCYRTWEAVLSGSIPIVLHSYLDREFEDLPILTIPSWDCITEEYLLEKLEEFSQRRFNVEKMLSDYWIQKIMSLRERETPCAKKTVYCRRFSSLIPWLSP